MKKTLYYIFCIIICLAIGFISGIFTRDAISGYYLTLNKPSWNPPNWIFAPVWSTLYLMMGIAWARVKIKLPSLVQPQNFIFITQLILNFFWSIIFFYWQSPFWAFIEILVLNLAIILCFFSFKKIDSTAAYLLVPYWFWVSFATFLTFTIWQLNP